MRIGKSKPPIDVRQTSLLLTIFFIGMVACTIPKTTIPATASNQTPLASPLLLTQVPSATPHYDEWLGLQYEEDEWTSQPESSPLLVHREFECSIRFLRGGFDYPPDWSLKEGHEELGQNEFDTGAFYSSDGALKAIAYGYNSRSNPRQYLGAFYVFAPADIIDRCIQAAEALLATFNPASLEEPVHTPSPTA